MREKRLQRTLPLSAMRLRQLTLLCVASFLIAHTGRLFADAPVFHPPPRLATTAAELELLRQSPGFTAQRDQAVQAAEGLLKSPVVVPDGCGDWSFYYACPDDGNRLQAGSLTDHTCPKCKKSYQDERTCAAYRSLLHDDANRAAKQLGWAYALSGDERFAAEVRRILLKLAGDYSGYPPRRDRWGRTGILAQLGGRRYSQSLDEAVGIIELAKAYDLTRSSTGWSAEDRKRVEEQLFRATANTLLFANRDINNHQTWYNAGLMAIASVLGDEALVNRVLSMPGGVRDQLKRSFDDDGLWYEGSMAYQNYALQAMVELVEAARRIDLPLHREPRFRTLLLGPTRYCYPNGQFPTINDSDRLDISSFDWSFAWAAKTFDDWNGNPRPAIETRSENLSGAGLAMLRRGTGERAVCAMLDYGPHGGGHGHFDKLNLLLFANGREWLLDPGRLDYSHQEYQTWVKETAAHNTVTIDEKSQAATTGKLLWFETSETYSACAARCDTAYPNVSLTRYLFLCDSFLAEVMTVSAPHDVKCDWFAHADSRALEPFDQAMRFEPVKLALHSGYQHLANPQGFSATGDLRMDFVAPDEKRLRVWLVGAAGEQLIATDGIGYTIESRVPCLIRRRQGKQVSFATIYDLSGDGSSIKNAFMSKDATLAIEVETSQRKWNLDFGSRIFSK